MIRRLWKRGSITSESKRIIWDMGNEFWEMFEGELRRFQIHSRESIQEELLEIVSLLPESPIPLEAIQNDVGSNWTVLEGVIPSSYETERLPLPDEKPLKLVKVSSPRQQSHQQPRKPRQASNPKPLGQVLAQGAQTQTQKQTQVQPLQQGQVLPLPSNVQKRQKKNKKTSSENSSYSSSPPSESEKHLWSSLSQWIPPYALYQPSLHSQAILEMTEKTVHIHLSPKQYKPKSRLQLSGPSFL